MTQPDPGKGAFEASRETLIDRYGTADPARLRDQGRADDVELAAAENIATRAARTLTVGSVVYIPNRLKPGDRGYEVSVQLYREPGPIVSIDSTGWAMVDLGSWGQFGSFLADLRPVADADHPPDLVGAVPASHQLADLTDLALALGGDITSFTSHLLQLVAKADPNNRHRLRIAFPRVIRAWELWMEHAPDLTAGQLRQLLHDDPITTAFMALGEQLEGLQALRLALGRG